MSLAVSERQQVAFERGFKSWCENTAEAVRDRLGIRRVDPLPAKRLAQHLDVRVWTPQDVPTLPEESLAYLTSAEGDEWSAATIRVGAVDVVVLNPTHSKARQESDLMHELAHVIRNHEPAQIIISEEIGVGIRTFNDLQEAEANWLSGCLLLPRVGLAYAAARKMRRAEMCERYGVSMDLLRYRLNVTGLARTVP